MLDFGFYNMDCMQGMAEFPDKFFDLAIVDPPYGINVGSASMGAGVVSHLTKTAPLKIGGGTEPSEVLSRSAIQVGGVSASIPKSTRRSMTATHRAPHTSKNYHEWQKDKLYGAVTTSLIISALPNV